MLEAMHLVTRYAQGKCLEGHDELEDKREGNAEYDLPSSHTHLSSVRQ